MKYKDRDVKGSQQIAQYFNNINFNVKAFEEKISQIKPGANSCDQITSSLLRASAPHVINDILYILGCIINGDQFPKV